MPATENGENRPRKADVSIEVLHQQLQDGIDAIESGEDWRAWLNFAGRLHRYSFNNLILIWRQRPDATSIASYRTWHSVHRQVRRGERALRVMAPVVRRTTALDNEGKVVLGPDGQPGRRQQVVGFRHAAVFDISQTDGPPVPEPERPVLLTGPAPEGLWDALGREVSERGYRLLRGGRHQLDGANGMTKVAEREVWIRDDVDDAQAVKTLAHEVAHVLLHTGQDDPQGTSQCAGFREVEAESVAHLVLAAHGVATAGYSFPYVATWAYSLAAVEHVAMSEIVSRTGTRVMDAARNLIDATMTSADASPADRAQLLRSTDSARRTNELCEKTASSILPPADRSVLLSVLADTHEYFRCSVRRSWVPDYLNSRAIGAALDSHELGYARKQWTTLTDHLRSLGYTDDHIEAAGVARRSQQGHLIDHLRDRVTIPLRSADREIVGFTARVNPNSNGRTHEPKYLNTPATSVFHKGQVLYGLPEHLEQVQAGRVPVLCEGPIDAIAVNQLAHAVGLPMVGLASAGTAFTEDQARQLLAAVGDRTICLAFDADFPGLAASEKAWRTLTEEKPHAVVVAALPPGADPASLLVAEPDALIRSLGEARPAALVLAEQKIADAHLDGDAGRELMAFRQLTQLAERTPAGERAPYLVRIAELLHIDVSTAAAEVGERHPHLLAERALEPRTAGCLALRETMRQEASNSQTRSVDIAASRDGITLRVGQS